MTLDTVRYTFEQGTGAIFVGDRPHWYANEGDVELRGADLRARLLR